VSAIAAKVDPALVDVNVEFGFQNAGGAGTGIVLTPTGEVLTNNHVIDGATSVSVTDIGNGKTYSATVVGYDSTHDMAVLQLHGASGLQTASISSSAPTVGEPVVAIGNAGGVGGTPSAAGGSVIGLDQSITASDSLDGTSEQLSGLIETNADIQAGDSGGSLVNADGQVVGMDTAASSGYSFQSPQSSGTQGFAIPISQAFTTARQIEAGDGTSVIHVGATAFLGVTVSSGSSGSSGGGFGSGGFGNFPGQGSSVPGADVSGLVNGGAAQVAGVQTGDVITSLAGQTVDSSSALSKILVSFHPGESVEIGWTDTTGQTHTTTVDLGSGPPA
jgi:S1-C subfamily serine protease